MVARSSLEGLFQLMVLPEASALARGPSSHQERHLQPTPAPRSVVLSPPLPQPPVLRPWAGPNPLPVPPRPPPHSRALGGPLCVPAEAGGVYGVVRLSPPAQPARLYCCWALQRAALAERIW